VAESHTLSCERLGFSRADIFVLLGCWVDTYRPAILCGHRDSSEPAFARIAKDRTPRTIQGAEPRLGTSLVEALTRQLDTVVDIVSDSSGTASRLRTQHLVVEGGLIYARYTRS
jgi:hypothetical protein